MTPETVVFRDHESPATFALIGEAVIKVLTSPEWITGVTVTLRYDPMKLAYVATVRPV